MKTLILALSLLFLTGTHGRAFLQSDEPQPATDDVIEAILDVVDKAVKFGSEAVHTLESSDLAKHINVNEKLEALKAKLAQYSHEFQGNAATIREQVDKKLQENNPVFKEKALPVAETSLQRLQQQGLVKKDVRADIFRSVDNLRSLGQEFRDKLRSEAETLQRNLFFYEAELREKYKKKSA